MGKKKHRKARDTSTALVAPELPSSGDGSVLTPVAEIRRRARKHLEQGAVTAGYQADRGRVLALLDAALATEIVCVLRYKRHYFMAVGLVAERIAIDSYAEMIRYIGDGDPTTRRMLEAILAMEEEHADDLVGMLATLGRPR